MYCLAGSVGGDGEDWEALLVRCQGSMVVMLLGIFLIAGWLSLKLVIRASIMKGRDAIGRHLGVGNMRKCHMRERGTLEFGQHED